MRRAIPAQPRACTSRRLAFQSLGLQDDVLLKVPHHGTESLAPDGFFAAVAPDWAFVPAPASLWCSVRSQRPRTWLEQRHVPTWVSGFSGHVQVVIDEQVTIKPEDPAPDLPCRSAAEP
jgi:hypothetical protein